MISQPPLSPRCSAGTTLLPISRHFQTAVLRAPSQTHVREGTGCPEPRAQPPKCSHRKRLRTTGSRRVISELLSGADLEVEQQSNRSTERPPRRTLCWPWLWLVSLLAQPEPSSPPSRPSRRPGTRATGPASAPWSLLALIAPRSLLSPFLCGIFKATDATELTDQGPDRKVEDHFQMGHQIPLS